MDHLPSQNHARVSCLHSNGPSESISLTSEPLGDHPDPFPAPPPCPLEGPLLTNSTAEHVVSNSVSWSGDGWKESES